MNLLSLGFSFSRTINGNETSLGMSKWERATKALMLCLFIYYEKQINYLGHNKKHTLNFINKTSSSF